MVFDDLLSALVARLNTDAFFTDPSKGVQAIAANRMDLLTEADVALAKIGMVCVVEITRVIPDQQGAYHGAVIVTVTVQVHEVPFVNRAESGSQKTAQQVLCKCKSLWDRPWCPVSRDVWDALRLARFELADTDEATGRVTWQMDFETRTMLETVVQVLATEGNRPLVTENNEALVNSPTPA